MTRTHFLRTTLAPGLATAESNWNKPIEKPAKASQAAAVSTGGRGTGGSMGVFAIMGGVLLVGFAGLVFALWSRNRLAGHC